MIRLSKREIIAVYDTLLFWITPDNKYMPFDEGEHQNNMPEEYGEDVGEAIRNGWIRGFITHTTADELILELTDHDRVMDALDLVPLEYAAKVKRMVIDVRGKDYILELDENEDIQKAWQNRNSIRKRIANKRSNKMITGKHFKSIQASDHAPLEVHRNIDGYTARKGLEGPFKAQSGKVVYYDRKEGKYYDPRSDMYFEIDFDPRNDQDRGQKELDDFVQDLRDKGRIQ